MRRKLSSGRIWLKIQALLPTVSGANIMKVQALLPTAQAEHSPYHGCNMGDIIQDHGQAFSYLMDCFPELLP